MRNLPSQFHDLAQLRTRREYLDRQADAAILTGRILAQPRIGWFDSHVTHRTQPRGPNGRFLSKAWLADAELFLPSDRAFFRSPIRCTECE